MEVWLRGPLPDLSPWLQPVAHALLQAVEDIRRTVDQLPADQLWVRPGGAPSVGFHVRHATGSLDRLFTYARGEALTAEQLAFLESEAEPSEASTLALDFERQVERALAQLRATPESALLEPRGVGRLQLPSTVLGLLVHTAEHTQRHVGQIITTAKIVKGLGLR